MKKYREQIRDLDNQFRRLNIRMFRVLERNGDIRCEGIKEVVQGTHLQSTSAQYSKMTEDTPRYSIVKF